MNHLEFPPSEQEPPRNLFSETVEVIATLIKTLVITGAILLFVGQVTIVQGFSMEPNLHTDQRLIIDKISYQFYEPERGDIVVVEIPTSEVPLIKRVIAVAGERIEIKQGVVFINGVQLDEPYLTSIGSTNLKETLIPSEHVFVMGDNRPNSRDSRAFGAVDIYRITAKARFSLWPPDDFGILR